MSKLKDFRGELGVGISNAEGIEAPPIMADDGFSAPNDRKGTCWNMVFSIIVSGTGLLDTLDVGVKTGVPFDEEDSEAFSLNSKRLWPTGPLLIRRSTSLSRTRLLMAWRSIPERQVSLSR